MLLTTFLWTLPSLLAAVSSAWVYWYITTLGPRPGALALRVLLLAITFWALTAAASLQIHDEQWRTALASLRYLGIVTAPAAWFAFCLNYAARRYRLPRSTLATLVVMPVITLGLVASNSWHGWHWSSVDYEWRNGILAGNYRHGWAFYLHSVYSYLLMLAGVAILAFSLSHKPHHRRQFAAVLLAPMPVVAVNLLYILELTSGPRVDLTPMSFSLGAALLGYALMRHSLMDLLPIARDAVIAALHDPVLVVDSNQRIIDINPSACSAINTRLQDAVGRDLAAVLPAACAAELLDPEQPETTLGKGQGARVYDIRRSAVDNNSTHSLATVMVLRDVSARRQAEASLKEAQMELETANRALTWLANTDALTGLPNRRHFMERLREETSRAQRYQRPLSLMMLDLDRFKDINDSHGHPVGDRVLVTVAKLINSVRRRADVTGRVGGEEFSMVLPETDLAGAQVLADRLRALIAQTPIATDDGQVLQVTASIGVTSLLCTPGNSDSIGATSDSDELLLRRADEALYAAKHAGRNLVRSALLH